MKHIPQIQELKRWAMYAKQLQADGEQAEAMFLSQFRMSQAETKHKMEKVGVQTELAIQ
jgi:hypothetical protein